MGKTTEVEMVLLMSKDAKKMSTWDMSPQGTENKPEQSCCFRKPCYSQ